MKTSILNFKTLLILGIVLIFASCNNNSDKPTYRDAMRGEATDVVTEEVYVHDSMIIVKVSETPVAETPHKVDVRKIYDKSSAQVIIIKLEPGESLKEHITPVDVFFYILEGTADIMVGDEIKSVDADCLVESPKDIKHCIYNRSDDILRVMVVKAPRQTGSTTIL
ncbi:MAG: cupin domain-containing protein [Bacteroidales bacterium]|nr:cupin domain-containing protein [Bacteroidales bacterium]